MIHLFIFTLSLLLSSLAQACPVCGFGQDGTAEGFIVTTVLLTALPLILFAAIVYFLKKRHQRIQNED